ncbi:MAG: hypothetical protein ACLR8U_05745 [Oscillospiraceae bacterium]
MRSGSEIRANCRRIFQWAQNEYERNPAKESLWRSAWLCPEAAKRWLMTFSVTDGWSCNSRLSVRYDRCHWAKELAVQQYAAWREDRRSDLFWLRLQIDGLNPVYLDIFDRTVGGSSGRLPAMAASRADGGVEPAMMPPVQDCLTLTDIFFQLQNGRKSRKSFCFPLQGHKLSPH